MKRRGHHGWLQRIPRAFVSEKAAKLRNGGSLGRWAYLGQAVLEKVKVVNKYECRVLCQSVKAGSKPARRPAQVPQDWIDVVTAPLALRVTRNFTVLRPHYSLPVTLPLIWRYGVRGAKAWRLLQLAALCQPSAESELSAETARLLFFLRRNVARTRWVAGRYRELDSLLCYRQPEAGPERDERREEGARARRLRRT